MGSPPWERHGAHYLPAISAALASAQGPRAGGRAQLSGPALAGWAPGVLVALITEVFATLWQRLGKAGSRWAPCCLRGVMGQTWPMAVSSPSLHQLGLGVRGKCCGFRGPAPRSWWSMKCRQNLVSDQSQGAGSCEGPTWCHQASCGSHVVTAAGASSLLGQPCPGLQPAYPSGPRLGKPLGPVPPCRGSQWCPTETGRGAQLSFSQGHRESASGSSTQLSLLLQWCRRAGRRQPWQLAEGVGGRNRLSGTGQLWGCAGRKKGPSCLPRALGVEEAGLPPRGSPSGLTAQLLHLLPGPGP